jgi:uncharacterized protein (TIGR00661 family)
MKVLYAIQGTGNGHLSRARDIIPILKRKPIELDILVSGTQADVQIPYPVRYRFQGLSFIFGERGGVDVWRTYLKANARRLQREMNSLPVQQYDLVINDFEPVSAWACKLSNQPCISLSHQAAVLASGTPKPKKRDPMGEFILRKYAPGTLQFGFHFKPYQPHIFTPVIRQEIRQARVREGNYYTVYLPAYNEEKLIETLSRVGNTKWEVFSKHSQKIRETGKLLIRPVTNEAFVKSMAGSRGILCGAGFETPAEALFLRKKLMVIPMKRQYEQQCNMAALREMGVPVLKSLKRKHLHTLQEWVDSDVRVAVDYPDNTAQIIDQLLETALEHNARFSYGEPSY